MNKDHSSEGFRPLKPPHWLGRIGLAIILFAFVLAVINALLATPIEFVKATLQPFIFVGLGMLLYHIGQHVHVLHENALRMMGKSPTD